MFQNEKEINNLQYIHSPEQEFTLHFVFFLNKVSAWVDIELISWHITLIRISYDRLTKLLQIILYFVE